MLINFRFPLGGHISLAFSSLYWITGLGTLITGTLVLSTRIITDESFSPELMLRLVEQYKVTVILTPPAQMSAALNCPDIEHRDLSSVQLYFSGGSGVAKHLIKGMESYLKNAPVLVLYGTTEIASYATGQTVDSIKEGSSGQVRDNIAIKIVDESGAKLGIGEKGEICINIGLQGLGYYKNPKATKEAFDSEGWFHSGDIGYFDEDGHLYIFDRKKEILKYKGLSYSPTEIENVISQIPDVAEVCVCGLPDVVAIDLPAAAIIRKSGSNLTEKDVYDFVARKLDDYKHLRGGVFFVGFLPKTASGKTIRRRVRDILIQLRREKNILEK